MIKCNIRTSAEMCSENQRTRRHATNTHAYDWFAEINSRIRVN